MFSEGDAVGQPSTTTISTVAVQAGDSQIVVSVLKCGKLVQLQLTEAQPNLLEIGSNQDETKKLLQEHEQLLTKLKRNEAGVWALLEEADKTANEKPGEEQVYEAMAASLSEAWKTLVSHLEKRRSLLVLACHFFECALEFAIKIDDAEDFQNVDQDLTSADMNEVLQRHGAIRRGMLEKSMVVLNKSRELLEFLKDFQSEQALWYGRASHGAWSSFGKVEGLMEILQDRRRQVDLCMREQQRELEMIHHICQWERQEEEVTQWIMEKMTLFLENNHLGLSLSENEDLLQEHKEFEQKVKVWCVLVERLLQQASELLSTNNCCDLQHLCEKSEKLKATHEQFSSLMLTRLSHLQDSNAFYRSANKAFEVLGSIEVAIKELKTKSLPLPELAKKHEELLRSIKEASTDPVQKGQLLLQKLNPQSVGGVQRMLGYIKERVEMLKQECHAHRKLTDRRQRVVSSFEDLVEKVSTWIKKSHSVLSANTEPGSTLTEAEDSLNKHVELLSQSQDIIKESEAIGGLIKELQGLESPETVELSNKASLLAEEMKTLVRNISTRVESLRPYVDFLRSADEVDEQIKTLQECYKNKPEEEEENEGVGTSMKEMLDVNWQTLLQRFFTMQDLGNNFINSSNMVSGNMSLNVKVAGHVVERYMETLSKKKSELADLWTSWQLHYSQIKSVKKQWKKFKEQVKKVLHDLKSMEEIFAPASKVDLGGDAQTVSKLQENFNSIKPEFLQLNAEVEFLVKTSELLALKGIPVKEKNERVSELLQLHQRVRDKMREYETVLSMAVKFHQLYQELDTVLKTEPVTVFNDTSQARTQLIQHQERQKHVRHLYKLALSLGADITNTVQQSRLLVLSVPRLHEKLGKLERGSVNWITEANKCEESLMSNVHCCLYKEEISELRESFKDLKKKFNNLKFNYMKKNEKSRNLKAVKNQIQQIEIYVEKLQVLKKKLQAFTQKVSSSCEKHLIGNSLREIEDASNELQRQVGDFDRTVEEYKQNLEMNVKLQQALEEYHFWCDEASSTIVRVGKYSSQCKTKEAISSLYKQFEKFIWPTIPQQEERINQITELAVRLHGPEEGKKYMEKTVNKHHEIVESIKELSNGLLDLEAKLQLETLKQPPTPEDNNKRDTVDTPEQKESGHTPEMTGPHCTKEIPINKKPQLRKTTSQDLPDRLHPEHQIVSETRCYTQEAFSKTSKVETITSKSTVERREKMHTTFSHTHTVNVSHSPAERDKRRCMLQHTKRDSQETPPPPPPPPPPRDPGLSRHHIRDEKEFQGTDKHFSAQKTHSEEKYQGFSKPRLLDLKTAGHHSIEEEFLSHGTPEPSAPVGNAPEGDFHPELLTEESLSNDEYECTSPDDISLPPLSETPESNILQSENDLDDGYCVSSHSLRINQYSHQSHTQHGDTVHQKREWMSSQAESNPSPTTGLGAKFRAESSSFVQSPLTVPAPSLVSNTLSSILKSKSGNPPVSLTECHETLYSVHESHTEMQRCVHDSNTGQRPSNTHANPTPLTTEPDSDVCKPTAIREEIRRASSKKIMGNLAAGSGPNVSKPLSNATVMEGSPVTLEVEVTGFPEPTLTWLKNGHTLANDEHIELSHKEGKHALYIQSAAVTDSGQYAVTATNSAGTVTSSSVLQVKVHRATSHFHNRLSVENVLVEEDLSSHCTYPQVLFMNDTKMTSCDVNQRNDPTLSSIGSVDALDLGACGCVMKDERSAQVIYRETEKLPMRATDYVLLQTDPDNPDSFPAPTGTDAV